jgi:hypothetical protein
MAVTTISVKMYPKLLNLDEEARPLLTYLYYVRGLTFTTPATPGS